MTALPAITLVILALGAAGLATYRAASILHRYAATQTMPPNTAKRAMRAEARWRMSAHILWFVSLAPAVLPLLSRVNTLTDLALAAFGATATTGTAVAIVKWATKTPIFNLFTSDISVWNETALALAGLGMAFLAALSFVLLSRPSLAAALQDSLF